MFENVERICRGCVHWQPGQTDGGTVPLESRCAVHRQMTHYQNSCDKWQSRDPFRELMDQGFAIVMYRRDGKYHIYCTREELDGFAPHSRFGQDEAASPGELLRRLADLLP